MRYQYVISKPGEKRTLRIPKLTSANILIHLYETGSQHVNVIHLAQCRTQERFLEDTAMKLGSIKARNSFTVVGAISFLGSISIQHLPLLIYRAKTRSPLNLLTCVLTGSISGVRRKAQGGWRGNDFDQRREMSPIIAEQLLVLKDSAS
jgi:hypothetical protein